MSPDFNPAEWQRLWSAWNIRGCVILAVILQLFLVFCAPIRRRTSNQFRILTVWFSYLLSDWTAVFVCGLITNSIHRSCPGQSSQVSVDYLALWAAYLLVYLGGPDSITAFSLEDNALWPRHLGRLVAQVSAFLYIFGQMLASKNNLMVHTIVVLVAGIITYGERSRSLYLASLERMKKLGEESILLLSPSDIDTSWWCAYQFSQTLKGLVVDTMPSKAKLQKSRIFFLEVDDAEVALDVLTKEMSFLYDMLYTKTLALHSRWGRLSRIVSSLSLGIVAFWLSSLVKQERNKIDYWITILLVYETFLLQIVSSVMFYRPYWKHGKRLDSRISPQTMPGIPSELWSEDIGTFNLLAYCFEEITQRGCFSRSAFSSIAQKIEMAEVIAEFQHASKIPFEIQLWKFVFDELKVSFSTDANSHAINDLIAREIYEARGNLALGRANSEDLMQFIRHFEYDSTLLMWHIATIICYHLDEAYKEDEIYNRMFSETISNYMVYLMVQQPKLMSPVIGIGYERFRDTCDEMKRRGRSLNPTDMKDLCVKLLVGNEFSGEPGEIRKSVLQDSCNLARILLSKDKKWKIISKVWVELLSFAAGHCRGESYARLLSEGGEFISFVWLLMAHLGIGPLVPVE